MCIHQYSALFIDIMSLSASRRIQNSKKRHQYTEEYDSGYSRDHNHNNNKPLRRKKRHRNKRHHNKSSHHNKPYRHKSSNHNKSHRNKSHRNKFEENRFTKDSTEFGTKGKEHRKKSRYFGTDLSEYERSDDASIDTDVVYHWNWRNESDECDKAPIGSSNKCPFGASIQEFEIAGVNGFRWNPNVADHEYLLINKDEPKGFWWTHYIENCLESCAKYHEYKFMKSIVEEYEWTHALTRVQDSKPEWTKDQ